MSKVVLLVVLFVCAVYAAAPERPNIPESFFAEVSVLVKEGGRFLYGGGLHAFDTPKGFGREDYRLEDQHHHIEFLHFLQRFDKHTVYELVNGEKECRKQHVNGTLQSPWEWVKNATYNGTVTHMGKTFDSWVAHFGTHGEVTRVLYVDPKNVHVPVHTFLRSTFNKEEDDFGITYIKFNASVPSDWVFFIPRVCEASAEELESGNLKDVNAVVYFANSNWNCGDVACTYRVADGSDQPGYACAEFTARSLAAGGFMGSLGPYQMGYCGAATGYNLCSRASLNQYFADHGFHKQSTSPGAVNAAWAVIGDGGDGAMSHACIGVGPGTVDCHNIARQGHAASGSFYNGINVAWTPF